MKYMNGFGWFSEGLFDFYDNSCIGLNIIIPLIKIANLKVITIIITN